MITVTLLVVAASIWLLWEWRSGALSPDGQLAGRRIALNGAARARTLPTSAALNADAQVVARVAPRS